MTATEWAEASLEGSVVTPPEVRARAARVSVVDASLAGLARPSGRRFGTLVHALLAHVPLDGSIEAIARMASVQARMLHASDDERVAAAEVAERALAHDVFARARAAVAAGRACQREMPLAVMAGDVLVDGQADAAFDDGPSWLVVDFKTDVEIAAAEPAYRLQVALYADAIARAYGREVEAVLLRV